MLSEAVFIDSAHMGLKGDPIAGWARVIELMRTSPYDEPIVKDERTVVLEAYRSGIRVRMEIELDEDVADLATLDGWISENSAVNRTSVGVAIWAARAFFEHVTSPRARKAQGRA